MASKKAEQAPKSGDERSVQDIMDEVQGHDHIEVEDEDGHVWKFGFDRALVRKMERDGFNITKAMDGFDGSTLTDVEGFYREFFFPAFKKYQPKATEDEFFQVISKVPDKQEFLGYMTALYMQPVAAITANPTHSRAKLRLV